MVHIEHLARYFTSLVFMVHIEHLARSFRAWCESVPKHLARYFTSLVFMVYYFVWRVCRTTG